MTRKKSSSTDEMALEDVTLKSFTKSTVKEAYKQPPTEPSRTLAVLLEGTPRLFSSEFDDELQVLLREGIAADFGGDGWARGHLWRSFIRKG